MHKLTQRFIYLLSPNDWLVPVKSIVTGQEPFLLQDAFGKSENGKMSVLTARYCGAGNCNKGGHSGGFGMGHVPTWSKSEYSTPHFSSRHVSPCFLVQTQPHLFLALSNWLFNTDWRTTSNRHNMNGNMISRTFVITFRFWKKRAIPCMNHTHKA